MKILLACILALLPSVGWAAYQNPTVVANERQPNGFVKLTFQFTGNAGEPTIRRDFWVRPNTNAAALRNWVDDTINELDLLQTASTIPSAQPGQTVPRLARTPVSPTAKQVWNEKFERYLRAKDSGLTSATMASDLASLKADLEATYVAGHIH